jgi:hypothetical protein
MANHTKAETNIPSTAPADDPELKSPKADTTDQATPITDLSQVFEEAGEETRPPIGRLRIPLNDPRIVIGFTTGVEEVFDHYVEELGDYSLCPAHHGPGECCLCDLGQTAQRVMAMPLYEPEQGVVSVLRVPFVRTPTSLLSQIHQNFLTCSVWNPLNPARDGF